MPTILTCIFIRKDVDDIPFSSLSKKPEKVWQIPLERDKIVLTKNENCAFLSKY